MSSEDVEQFIRQNVLWSKLPEEVRIVLGSSQREYDKLVLEYSIKNQLRYKGNIGSFQIYCNILVVFKAFGDISHHLFFIFCVVFFMSFLVHCCNPYSLFSSVRHVKRNEEQYYDIMLKYSETHLMLYPYHLQDIVVCGLRMTPFNYYMNIVMVNILHSFL